MIDSPSAMMPDRGATQGPQEARWRDGPLLVSMAFLVSLVGAVFAIIAVAVSFAVAVSLRGERSTERILEAAQSTPAAWTSLILSQAVSLVVAILACWIVAARPRDRLGLTAPALGLRETVVLLAATIVPVVLALLAASIVPSWGADGAQGLARMWSEGSRTTSVLWVLTIALIPGVVEEVFYRGLVLRGFLMRWRPMPAILASSALFALAHMEPSHAAFTFVVGVWFGVVAWRTGSVVLPILMHAGMNGSWTTIQMIAARDPASEATVTVASAITIAVGTVAFVWGIRVLRRCDPRARLPRAASLPSAKRLAQRVGLVGGGLASAAALLFWVIPPGAVTPRSESSLAPSVSALRSQVQSTVRCPSVGEASFELQPGGTVRVELPANRLGMQEVIVALDDTSSTLWIAYDEAVTGKKVGSGVLEQLRSGDPTVVFMRHEALPPGLHVRFSLLQDHAAVDAVWAMVEMESGWATRGRK